MLRPGNAGANAVADQRRPSSTRRSTAATRGRHRSPPGDDPSLVGPRTSRSARLGRMFRSGSSPHAGRATSALRSSRGGTPRSKLRSSTRIGLEDLWQPANPPGREPARRSRGDRAHESRRPIELPLRHAAHRPAASHSTPVPAEPLPSIDYRYWGALHRPVRRPGHPRLLRARSRARSRSNIARLKDSGLCRVPVLLASKRTGPGSSASLPRRTSSVVQLLCCDGAIAIAASEGRCGGSFFHAPGRLVRSARREIVPHSRRLASAEALLSATDGSPCSPDGP